ncbi:MAG: hypothetical protein U5L09_00480 [Bacteroidales bacterium]|nr:hypothetical protein [Bacteroidales bacterium]
MLLLHQLTLAARMRVRSVLKPFLLHRQWLRGTMNFNNSIKKVLPDALIAKIQSRFERSNSIDGSSFDLLRASVNLVVVSNYYLFCYLLKVAALHHLCHFYGSHGHLFC